MHSVSLRKVGGSVMLALPPSVLATLNIGVGSQVDLDLSSGNLVVVPSPKPRYALSDLLAESDYAAAQSDAARSDIAQHDTEWVAGEAIGDELI